MTYNSYSQVNTLDEIAFIAGTTQPLDFTISENGLPVEVDLMNFSWRMTPYGRKDYIVVTKLNEVITAPDTYTRRVTLLPEDTVTLKAGKYVHQITIVSSGKTYRPAQGTITITSAIQ
jgi:hypothetical protein